MVFVFGNPLVAADSIALNVAAVLKDKMENVQFEFIESIADLENLPRHLLVLDTVENADKISVIEDLDQLKSEQPVSGHDFDFAMEAKMMLKLGKIDSIAIIAVPADYELGKAVRHVELLIRRFISS